MSFSTSPSAHSGARGTSEPPAQQLIFSSIILLARLNESPHNRTHNHQPQQPHQAATAMKAAKISQRQRIRSYRQHNSPSAIKAHRPTALPIETQTHPASCCGKNFTRRAQPRLRCKAGSTACFFKYPLRATAAFAAFLGLPPSRPFFFAAEVLAALLCLPPSAPSLLAIHCFDPRKPSSSAGR